MTQISAKVKINSDEKSTSLSKEGKRALFAATFGFFVDMFDVYLPTIVLGPAMVYFEPRGLDPSISTTLFYLVFALSLIGRPIGSFIFGHFGDKIGRRKTTLIAVAGCSVTTLFMALIPGYATWGLTGIILIAVFRLISGVFLGGEYTGATPLAMEYSPKLKRGFFGGCINSGYPAALVVVSLITLLIYQIAPAAGPESPYAVWGWRIPFLFGALISFILWVYLYKRVPESKAWKESKKTSSPLRELFSGESLKNLSIVFIVMSGVWFVLNGVVSALPGILQILHVDNSASTSATLIANFVLLLLFAPIGALSQKISRRWTIFLFGILSLTVAPFLYFFLVNSGYRDTTALIVLIVIITALTISVYGVLTAYITEMFHTGVRASGYGIGYSLAVIVPSFTSFFMLALGHIMPYKYTEIIILMFGGVLLLVGGLLSPETRQIDFEDSDLPNEK